MHSLSGLLLDCVASCPRSFVAGGWHPEGMTALSLYASDSQHAVWMAFVLVDEYSRNPIKILSCGLNPLYVKFPLKECI